MISRWHKVDLHIHTDKSNLTKDNDYQGHFDVDVLVQAVRENSISLISLTDHNIINCEAYKDIIDNSKIDILVGVEIDIAISDEELVNYVTRRIGGGKEKIGIKPYHIVVIFKSQDYKKLDSKLDQMYSRISEELLENKIDLNSKKKLRTASFRYLFECFSDEDFFIISHGDKDKGIVSPYKASDTLEDAQYNILLGDISALEMQSKITLQNTIAIYNEDFKKLLKRKFGEETTSYVVFSDNHDCDNYTLPAINTWLKGHCDFETLRLCFSDPLSRVHTADSPPKEPLKYIEHIKIKPISSITSSELELSPYLNVIIGGRSSGKSLLFNTLIKGNNLIPSDQKDVFENNYNKHIDLDSTFFKLSDGEVENTISIKCDSYCQERIINIFDDDKELKDSLQDSFHDFDEEEVAKQEGKLSYVFNELKEAYGDFYVIQPSIEIGDRKSQIAKSIETSNKLFEISEDLSEEEYEQGYYLEAQEEIATFLVQLKEALEWSFKGTGLFSVDDKAKILDVVRIAEEKQIIIAESFDRFRLVDKFFTKVKNIHDNYVSNDLSHEFQQIEQAKRELRGDIETCSKYFTSKLKLRKACEALESLSFDNADKVKNTEKYDFVTKLNFKISKEIVLRDFFEECFVGYDSNKSIFSNVLNIADPTMKNVRVSRITTIEGKKPHRVESKINDFVASKKSKKKFEIIEKGDVEIKTSSTSQGRKASIFIDIKLHSFLGGDDFAVLMIDQVEDNIDNKYISKDLVNLLRMLKNKMQVILVTHNPSIAIFGDAENIIISENTEDGIRYRQGGLENEEIRNEACEILDGGDVAFRNRMQKYNIMKLKSSLSGTA